MTQRLVDLSKSYPPLQREKMERYLERLKRMRRFYIDKSENVPSTQADMFNGFIHALSYAIDIVQHYSSLTNKLKQETQKDEEV